MNELFPIMAAAPRAARTLSEMELLRQHPVLWVAFAELLLLGVAADVWLLVSLARARGRLPLRVPAKAWGVHDLLAVTGLLLLTMFTGLGLLALVMRKADSIWFLAGDCALRLAFLAGLLAYVRRRGATLDWHWTPRGVIGFFAVLPPLAAASLAVTQVFHWLKITPTPQPVTLLFVETKSSTEVALLVWLALAVAPVFEEIFFRGFAYPALKQRWGALPAMLTVSAVFAAIHFHAESALPLFVLAIGFTLAYEVTGSLVAPVTMHILFNAANVAMLLYARWHP